MRWHPSVGLVVLFVSFYSLQLLYIPPSCSLICTLSMGRGCGPILRWWRWCMAGPVRLPLLSSNNRIWSSPPQVWSQPHFEWLELEFPIFEKRKVVKYGYRITYVCTITFLAILMPFFGVIIGFVGATGFWPTTVSAISHMIPCMNQYDISCTNLTFIVFTLLQVFFPVNCWMKIFRPGRKQRIAMRCLDIFCLLITIACIAASVYSIYINASSMVIFGN
jgi:hypothetical protein